MEIKVLGMGCSRCTEFSRNVETALARLGMDTRVGHVTDIAQIAAYGVMAMPGLVIGEKVVSSGKVLNVEELVELIKKQ